MNKEDLAFWLEVGKLAANIATPVIVAVIGLKLLRRIESIKSEVAKQSDFNKKWAEQLSVVRNSCRHLREI